MEVNLVVERGADEVAAVEVKAAATVIAADFRGLRKLQAAAGTRFRCGVVLYDGEHGDDVEQLTYLLLLKMTNER